MDWTKLPPLTALRAFAAFAQAGSTQSAGAQLNVSHAAISQQMKALEEHIGVALLDRSGRALALTAEGRRLADALVLGFGAIAREVGEIAQQGSDRPLLISTTPSFASSWLLPRLPEFRERHQGLELMMSVTPELVSFGTGGIDVAIRFGQGGWDGLMAELLVPTDIVVVAAPSLVEVRKITHPHELSKFHWLAEAGTTEATAWLKANGVEDGKVDGITYLPGNMMLDAARLGQGIVSTARCFVEDDIASGRLQLLFEPNTPSDTSGYYLVYKSGIQRAVAKAFCAWLRQTAAKR